MKVWGSHSEFGRGSGVGNGQHQKGTHPSVLLGCYRLELMMEVEISLLRDEQFKSLPASTFN